MINKVSVENISDCKATACMDKVNTFSFDHDAGDKMDEHWCKTMYCEWNPKENDYDIKAKLSADAGRMDVYSLAHLSKPCHDIYIPNGTVIIPLHFPSKGDHCGSQGDFKNTNFIPDAFCDSGFNNYQYLPQDSKYVTHKCKLNDEGTEWQFHPKNAYIKPESNTGWLILPAPGTPNLNGSVIFRLQRMRAEHLESKCGDSKTIYAAKDLRQCMLFAFETKGVNVINYFSSSSSTSVECNFRTCEKLPNGDYEFNYKRTEGNHGYDVYALEPDISIVPKNIIDEPPIKENVTLPQSNDTKTCLSEFQSDTVKINVLTGIVLVLFGIVIGLLCVFIYKRERNWIERTRIYRYLEGICRSRSRNGTNTHSRQTEEARDSPGQNNAQYQLIGQNNRQSTNNTYRFRFNRQDTYIVHRINSGKTCINTIYVHCTVVYSIPTEGLGTY
ncbi:unnamed protein product [Owenia fusiformis]|uniref:Uncharacterized protein n=1 Tax=Owenia fusiformis TaxID=6347 RepID=A0A8S4NAQ2_OWEFU|nr:unnamed protein product [Owenia fusiformis]